MSKMDSWDRELTKLFISLLKQCPCFYNPLHPDYKNKTKQNDKYEFMLTELRAFSPDLSLQDVMKKLRSLKKQYSKEKTKILQAKKGGKKKTSIWWCFKHLQFLETSENNGSDASDSNVELQRSGQTGSSNHERRIPNILTLQERVRVIEEYDRTPMYTKIASMFHCSWEQIKNIISNRKAIMDFYNATKNCSPTGSDPAKETLRQRKRSFLGECVYEYLQRAQFHMKAMINEDLIRTIAREFSEIIQLDGFTPNKAWINQFKSTYNISLSQGQIALTRIPPATLRPKDIVMFCSCTTANTATLEDMNQRRLRKISFLEKALYEYIQRAEYHHKVPPQENVLCKVASELKDMLKIDAFEPDHIWCDQFKVHYNLQNPQRSAELATQTPPPPFSLDLKDILSYCSRQDQKKNAKAKSAANANATQREFGAQQQQQCMELQPCKESESDQDVKTGSHLRIVRNIIEESILPTMDNEEEEEANDEYISADMCNVQIKTEHPSSDEDLKPPLLKIRKVESLQELQDGQPRPGTDHYSPDHWSAEHSSTIGSDDGGEVLPKHAKNYADALKLLKPLEEFAMLEENYRAIGLISQLESIFKNPPKTRND